MRKIIKEGKPQGIREAVPFKCDSCGEEWKTDNYVSSLGRLTKIPKGWIISYCDNCGDLVEA